MESGDLTKSQWKRRALKAEAELESIKRFRQHDHSMEMETHRRIAALTVAINEITEITEWAWREH